MNDRVDDFVVLNSNQLERQIKKIDERVKALQAEIEKLTTIRASLSSLKGLDRNEGSEPQQPRLDGQTYQEGARAILAQNSGGLTLAQLLSALKESGTAVMGTNPSQTLYVALYRGKKKGLFKYEGNVWKLAN